MTSRFNEATSEGPSIRRPQTHNNLAPVATITTPLDHAAAHQPIHELHDRMMTDLQTLGQHAQRRDLVPLGGP